MAPQRTKNPIVQSEWVNQQWPSLKGYLRHHHQYNLVFYNPEPESKYKVISNTGANKLSQKTLTELGAEPITMHGLRHTHASILLYKGVSIYYVSERLGHKDIDTTHKYYSHIVKELREEDEQKTVDTFEDM